MVRFGNRLQQERQKKHLTIDQVAHATKIKTQFLTAIEKGEYHKLPSPAYAQGFVRNYVSFLGLPKTEMLALFRREFDQEKAYKVLPEGFSRKEEFPLKRLKVQQSLLLGVAVLIVFLGYLFFQYRQALFSPSLAVVQPKENSIVNQAVIVKGKTDSDSTVFVNNDAVTVNDNGDFTKTLSLFPGKTQLIIKATNRFGKTTVILRDVSVKE